MLATGPRSSSRTLTTSSSARLDRWGSGGSGGGGGVGSGAVVEVLQVQFIDKVVDVLMQLKFEQSSVHGLFIDRVLDISVAHGRQPQCELCVPVISSDKFSQSRGSNPLAPDSANPQSGEHSCCATDFRRIPQVQFLVVWEIVDMPVHVQRQASFST